jgi:hypothetical protein
VSYMNAVRVCGYRSGCSVVGMDVSWMDPNEVKRLADDFRAKLDKVPVTFSVASALVSRGLGFTEATKRTVESQKGNSGFGPAMWESPAGHLKWHQDHIRKELAGRDPKETLYPRYEDLKEWVTQAYRNVMAATQEKELREGITSQFWGDIATYLTDLPANVVSTVVDTTKKTAGAVAELPGKVVETVTGVPTWAWKVGIAGGVALGGYALYKILLAAAPVATGVLVKRYLP